MIEMARFKDSTLECTSVIMAKVFEPMVNEYTWPFYEWASFKHFCIF